jgi:hypothetical protein
VIEAGSSQTTIRMSCAAWQKVSTLASMPAAVSTSMGVQFAGQLGEHLQPNRSLACSSTMR